MGTLGLLNIQSEPHRSPTATRGEDVCLVAFRFSLFLHNV